MRPAGARSRWCASWRPSARSSRAGSRTWSARSGGWPVPPGTTRHSTRDRPCRRRSAASIAGPSSPASDASFAPTRRPSPHGEPARAHGAMSWHVVPEGTTVTDPDLPIPGRLNLVIAGLQVCALGSLLWMAGRVDLWWCALALAPAYGVVMNATYSLIHEAEHNIFHPNARVNEAAGVLLALLFPAPFHLLRQGHLGHHLRNRSDDEAFDLYFPEDSAPWKWLQLYGILCGFYWVAVTLSSPIAVVRPSFLRPDRGRLDRPTAALLESLNPKYEGLIRAEAVAIL